MLYNLYSYHTEATLIRCIFISYGMRLPVYKALQRIQTCLITLLEYAFTVAIVQHNVPDFIHWKCEELLLFRVHS